MIASFNLTLFSTFGWYLFLLMGLMEGSSTILFGVGQFEFECKL